MCKTAARAIILAPFLRMSTRSDLIDAAITELCHQSRSGCVQCMILTMYLFRKLCTVCDLDSRPVLTVRGACLESGLDKRYSWVEGFVEGRFEFRGWSHSFLRSVLKYVLV